jgi:hypothetical protein
MSKRRKLHRDLPDDLLTLALEFAVGTLGSWALVQRVALQFRRCARAPRVLSHFEIHACRPEWLGHLTGARALDMHWGTTDAGLAGLASFAKLRTLNLSATEVTDAGLAHLTPLTQLQTLNLGLTKVTDAGLVHLASLAQLQTLDLSGTKVTNAGLAALAPIAQLRELYLFSTWVTDAGQARIRTANPHVKIIN